MHEVVFDARIVREGKINAVARLADVVPANQIALAIPLVNAVAAPVGDERGVAIFRALPDAFFDRLGRRRDRRFSFDAVIENSRAGNFLQINAVQGIGDDVLLDRRAIAGNENRGVVIEEIQTRTGDARIAQRDVIGAQL